MKRRRAIILKHLVLMLPAIKLCDTGGRRESHCFTTAIKHPVLDGVAGCSGFFQYDQAESTTVLNEEKVRCGPLRCCRVPLDRLVQTGDRTDIACMAMLSSMLAPVAFLQPINWLFGANSRYSFYTGRSFLCRISLRCPWIVRSTTNSSVGSALPACALYWQIMAVSSLFRGMTGEDDPGAPDANPPFNHLDIPGHQVGFLGRRIVLKPIGPAATVRARLPVRCIASTTCRSSSIFQR